MVNLIASFIISGFNIFLGHPNTYTPGFVSLIPRAPAAAAMGYPELGLGVLRASFNITCQEDL